MAKLTARFDIQDNISRKLRAIRGEVDSLERARAKVNRPMIMTVKDQATMVLKKLHMFVLRDIAKTHTLFVKLKDQASKPLNALSNFMQRRMPRSHEILVRAQDRATSVLQKINQYLSTKLLGVRTLILTAVDKAMPVMRRIADYGRVALSKGYNFTVRAIDLASKTVGRIASFANTAIPKTHSMTIKAMDSATRVIGSIKNALFSIPTLITVTLAAVGVGKLKDATIGAAMNFEDYGVAMDHWLKGDKEKSAELMKWMGRKADLTPFNSSDLFPALTSGVALAGGNIKDAQKLLDIAVDMAALTPGMTPNDAMDALTMAQMGNFVRMKSFAYFINKDSYDEMGWEGFTKDVGKVFKGGAEALAGTGRGILNTLSGYMQSQFRVIGDGILDKMKPRLQSIITWLNENQDKWGEWKETLERAGAQAGEFVFSRLEKGFSYLKINYLENEEFKKLSFEGKIKFISEDIGGWWNSKGKPVLNKWWKSSGKPWAEKIGLFIGEAVFTGIVAAIKKGMPTLGGMWKKAFEAPSVGTFGGAATGTALAIGAASLILNPLLKVGKGVANVFTGVAKGGKTLIGKIKGITRTSPISPSGEGGQTRSSRNQRYRNPWFNTDQRPGINTPNAGNSGSKMPKVLTSLGKLGKFAKGVPILGTALGALAIGTSSKKDMAGTAGSVGGGLGGAAAGAAIGSVVPGIGTAIGGIIGGVLGSFGGQAIGDWFSGNWDSIKAGAATTGTWISEKFNASITWVVGAWNSTVDWFSNSIWKPIADGASKATGWISEKWDALSGWFSESVWNPLMQGFDKTISFIVGLYDIGEQLVMLAWGMLSSWFNDNVWIPLTTAASIASDWISTKISDAWTVIQILWGLAATWFDEHVWIPLSTAASIAWEWITTSISNALTAVQTLWTVAVTWFQEMIWTPLMTTASIVGTWIGEKFTEGWNVVTVMWGIATGWFEETVWSPLRTGAELLGSWISTKFTEGWSVVTGIWGAASAYFEGNIWSPIKTGAGAVKDAIVGAFESAWKIVSGIFAKLGDTWDTIKGWGGSAIDYVVGRGEQRRGITPEKNATGGHITRPTLSWIGEAGNEYVIPTQNNLARGRMLLSQAASDLGMSVSDNRGSTVSKEQLSVVSSSGNKNTTGSKVRDIIIQITGASHYSNEMDAVKVGKIAVKAVADHLEEEYFAGGDMVIYE
ncbi:hypothetical protein [Peribacillus loiseleuriae]|uniref:hypothetical protein n=1 Tax=Peribacillus loiseleuriae TaxID=1679170 RepID=UPI003D0127AA